MEAMCQVKTVRSRTWLQFTIRDLLLVTAVMAVACAYCLRPTVNNLPRKTGRELDVAIFGRGFFQIKDPTTDLVYYTRCGILHLDADSRLVTGLGRDPYALEPAAFIPTDWKSIDISRNGQVRVAQPGTAAFSDVGQIAVACFANAEGLREVLPGVFQPTDDSGPPTISAPGSDAAGFLMQGWLDAPNDAAEFRLLPSDAIAIAALVALAWVVIELRSQRRELETLKDAVTCARAGH